MIKSFDDYISEKFDYTKQHKGDDLNLPDNYYVGDTIYFQRENGTLVKSNTIKEINKISKKARYGGGNANYLQIILDNGNALEVIDTKTISKEKMLLTWGEYCVKRPRKGFYDGVTALISCKKEFIDEFIGGKYENLASFYKHYESKLK